MRRTLKRLAKSAALAALGVTERLRDDRAVLLSFDDGPQAGVTEPILERLARFGARAVFFNVGHQVARSGDLLTIVHRTGHRIGNHSYEHPVEIPGDISVVLDDLRRCQAEVASKIGTSPTLYRPPLGQIRWSNLRAARRLGLSTVLWSVDSRDWQLASRAEAEQRGRELATAVRGGDIVLLHEHNEYVLHLLDRLLPTLAEKGLDLGRGAGQL